MSCYLNGHCRVCVCAWKNRRCADCWIVVKRIKWLSPAKFTAVLHLTYVLIRWPFFSLCKIGRLLLLIQRLYKKFCAIRVVFFFFKIKRLQPVFFKSKNLLIGRVETVWSRPDIFKAGNVLSKWNELGSEYLWRMIHVSCEFYCERLRPIIE